VVEGDDTVDRVARLFERAKGDVLMVRLKPLGWSNISREEIRMMVAEGRDSEVIGSVLEDRQIPSLHPDHSLDMSLRYVDRWQLVPVVNRANLGELEGVITQRDVLERYRDFGGE
jgi:chloride channel protein, CIC family